MSINVNKFFESAIVNKMDSNIHYPKPVYNIGCPYMKIAGLQPLKQIFFEQKNCTSNCNILTDYCFEYGNTIPCKCRQCKCSSCCC